MNSGLPSESPDPVWPIHLLSRLPYVDTLTLYTMAVSQSLEKLCRPVSHCCLVHWYLTLRTTDQTMIFDKLGVRNKQIIDMKMHNSAVKIMHQNYAKWICNSCFDVTLVPHSMIGWCLYAFFSVQKLDLRSEKQMTAFLPWDNHILCGSNHETNSLKKYIYKLLHKRKKPPMCKGLNSRQDSAKCIFQTTELLLKVCGCVLLKEQRLQSAWIPSI